MTGRDGGWLDKLERLPLAVDKPLLGYACSTLIVAAAVAARVGVERWMPVGYPYMGFTPALTLSCFLFGRRAGIYAALLSGVIAWYRFIPPLFTFKFTPAVAISLSVYAVVATIDIAIIHWMQRSSARLIAERERSHRLAENRETLFRELQHRVSNNIQMVGALLALQKREIHDPAARDALDEAARRLGTIGRLHRQLHDPDGGLIGLGPFLDQICRDVLDGAARDDIAVAVEVNGSLVLEADRAIPVALIVAEAVANAVEHGFAGRHGGAIRVALDHSEKADRRALLISDNGAGLPAGFTLEKNDSLGLSLAATLARQIGGEFRIAPGVGGGTEARLVLPA